MVCEHFEDPTALNISMGVFLITGITVSYIPQYIAIIKVRSSDGLSYPTLALAFLSGLLTLINTGILNWNPKLMCCSIRSVSDCLAFNLPVIQLFIGPLCLFFLYIVFLRYFSFHPNTAQTREDKRKEFRQATVVFALIFLAAIVLSIVAGVLYYDVGVSSDHMVTYAQACGVMSSIAIVVQWVPQIYTVYKLKSPGSLSILMLLMQIPGAILVVIFLAVLNHEDFTTWSPYVVTFIQQVILVVMCVIYMRRPKKEDPELESLIKPSSPSQESQESVKK